MDRPRVRMPASIWIGSGSTGPLRVWGRLTTGAIILVLTLAGCMPFASPVPSGRPVEEVYAEGGGPLKAAITVLPAPSPGTFERTRPVIYPPKVFAVFVPEHLDEERDFKIGAHWVFMKLRDSSWTEQPIDREPEASADVTPEEVERLRRGFSDEGLLKILRVPHEGDTVNGKEKR